MREIQTWKEEAEVALFVDDMILYLRHPMINTGELLGLKDKLGQVAGYKINF